MYNGFMMGGVFHNIGLLRKNFEYQIMPLYSFKNQELAGSAQFDYFIRPTDAFFRNLTLTASAERFALRFAPNYNRIVLGGTFDFAKRNESTKKSSSLNIRHIFIQSTLKSLDAVSTSQENNYNQIIFTHKNSRVLNPYSILIDAQQGSTFAKVSATWNYRISYKQKKKGLDIRFFAGTFLWTSNDFNNGPDVRYRLSGQTGFQDYLFNDIYIGRQEYTGLWSQQMSNTDGGFKVFSYRGQTTKYLATLNFKTSLPGKLPLKLYADFGTYENEENDREILNYNAGLIVSFIPDNFEVYIPLIVSKQIQSTLDLNTISFGERIRFVININALNPVRIFRTLDF
jgi:hypothetical protein